MRQKIASVRASHTRVYSGKGKLRTEVWQEGERRRYRVVAPFFVRPTDPRTKTAAEIPAIFDRAYDGKVVWSIHPRRTAEGMEFCVVSDEEPEGFGKDEVSVKSDLADLHPRLITGMKASTRSVRGGQVTTVEGVWKSGAEKGTRFRRVYHCSIPDLPDRIEYFTVISGREVMTTYTTVEYPERFDPEVFAFHPPKGVPILDHVKARKAILDGVAGKGPRAQVEGTTITLLGAFQEARGQVYILWTGGATPNIDCTGAVLHEDGRGYQGWISYEEDDRRRPRNYGKAAPGAQRTASKLGVDRPIQLRPFGWISGKPIYALVAPIVPSSPLASTKLTVKIPICKSGPNRTLRWGKIGAFFIANGHQVGLATFEVETIPVYWLFELLGDLDPGRLRSYGGSRVLMENVDKELSRLASDEHYRSLNRY